MDEEGRLLACRRPSNTLMAGKWEFPGGKVEQGETLELALIRELREELGCEVHIQSPLDAVEHHYSSISIRLLPFLCSLKAGIPAAIEHSEIRWLTVLECLRLDWAEADIAILKELIAAESR